MSPRFSYTARRLRELGIRRTLDKLARRSTDERRARAQRKADAGSSTYAIEVPVGPLFRRLAKPERVPGTDWLGPVCDEYLAHRFDILGSGWTHVEHGARYRGLEGIRYEAGQSAEPDPLGAWLRNRVAASNLKEARRVWSLVGDGYSPIDWHADIRTGYRWPETTWYGDVVVSPVRGADIKVPWELARCQHMPQMALLACWSSAEDRDSLVAEFRNQVLDFIATNPPRFGVNWACAMEVGIRLANWLVAYDLFFAAGCTFDDAFASVFRRSVFEHGRHVRSNLEGGAEFRGNHYLADLVGLLFAAAYLPETDETRSWWTFARDAMLVEIETQFLPDGGSYEASTGYHRLALEMAIYAVALLVGVDGAEVVPSAVVSRLERAAEFARDTATPEGCHPVIGDDDSGRLFKLGTSFRWSSPAEAVATYSNLQGLEIAAASRYWVEDHLDVRHLLAAVVGLVDRDDLAADAASWVDTEIVSALAGGAAIAADTSRDAATGVRIGDVSELEEASAIVAALPSDRVLMREFTIPAGGRRSTLHAYHWFGLYVFRGPRFYLAIRCGPVGQNGLGGHAHNDQLGVVLHVDATLVVRDPGSYVYTPLPERRNEYRSVRAHDAPRVSGREPASLDVDLFRLDDPGAHCVYAGNHGFLGYHDGYGSRVWRRVDIGDSLVRITDWSVDSRAQLLETETGPLPAVGYGVVLSAASAFPGRAIGEVSPSFADMPGEDLAGEGS